MKKRMVLMLAAVIAVIAILGGFKFFQIKKAMAGMNWTPPPETVTTVLAQAEEWSPSANAVGSVAAVNGVMVSADLPGMIDEITFQSGQAVNRGDVLVRLDTKQERAQLAAAQAQLELARLALQRSRSLSASGVLARESLDQAEAEFKSAEARSGEIRATIERKTIRAPFAGVLGIKLVNLGQYLQGGAQVVSLQAIRPVYVNFTVPQSEMSRLTPGSNIEVISDAFTVPETGRITAVDSVIDESTRNGRIQAIFGNQSGKLRPGMYVQAKLAAGAKTTAVTVPASAISYAPFGDSVFIVEQVTGKDGKSYRGVRQQFVKLGGARGDQVAVLSGVKAGEEVVTSGVFKLRPGAAVIVNNSVQPGNSSKPTPENS